MRKAVLVTLFGLGTCAVAAEPSDLVEIRKTKVAQAEMEETRG